MSMNKLEVAENEKKILGVFPNTYTFTKNLAEKSLMKNRGHVTVCLVRPAIIASSLREPFAGWTDSLSAAGGISLMTGLGLLNYLRARGDNRFDIIPVDIVTNQIITATAYGSLTKNEMKVYNSGTSKTNPITMIGYKDLMEYGFKFEKYNR